MLRFNRINMHRPKRRRFYCLSCEEFEHLELKQALWRAEERFQEIDNRILREFLLRSQK